MKKQFKELSIYLKLYDGYNKPRIDFQAMYKLFPQFTFWAGKNFGQYSNFGQAFEHKDYSMLVSDIDGNEMWMSYREYYDTAENSACLMSI